MSSIAEQNTSFYFIEEDRRNTRLQEQELAFHLTQYLIKEYRELLVYNKSALGRIVAADKIAKYSDDNTDLSILEDVAENDINPNVRMAARYSHEKLKKKFLHYR